MRKLPSYQSKLLPVLAGSNAEHLQSVLEGIQLNQRNALATRIAALATYLANRWVGIEAHCFVPALEMVAHHAQELSHLHTLVHSPDLTHKLSLHAIDRVHRLANHGVNPKKFPLEHVAAADAEYRQLMGMVGNHAAQALLAKQELDASLESAARTIFCNARYLTPCPEQVERHTHSVNDVTYDTSALCLQYIWPAVNCIRFAEATTAQALYFQAKATGKSSFELLLGACLELLLSDLHRFDTNALMAELQCRERLMSGDITRTPEPRYLSPILQRLCPRVDFTEGKLTALASRLR